MGADVLIYFKAKKESPKFEWGFLENSTITRAPKYAPEGVTHKVNVFGNDRYYGLHYERGVWPRIGGILMELFASEDIEEVWYGSDEAGAEVIEHEDVLDLSKHYMENGCRPYRGHHGTFEVLTEGEGKV